MNCYKTTCQPILSPVLLIICLRLLVLVLLHAVPLTILQHTCVPFAVVMKPDVHYEITRSDQCSAQCV